LVSHENSFIASGVIYRDVPTISFTYRWFVVWPRAASMLTKCASAAILVWTTILVPKSTCRIDCEYKIYSQH
jgi:hypothetical protein